MKLHHKNVGKAKVRISDIASPAYCLSSPGLSLVIKYLQIPRQPSQLLYFTWAMGTQAFSYFLFNYDIWASFWKQTRKIEFLLWTSIKSTSGIKWPSSTDGPKMLAFNCHFHSWGRESYIRYQGRGERKQGKIIPYIVGSSKDFNIRASGYHKWWWYFPDKCPQNE